MKKALAFTVCLCMTICSVAGLCESVDAQTATNAAPDNNALTVGNDPSNENGQPPQMPEGGMPNGEQPPQMPNGEQPPQMPEGGMPQGGMPGGSSKPESYTAVTTCSEDTELTDESLVSTGTDENALLVTGGCVSLTDSSVERTSTDSTGGDSGSFYGVGAAILCTDGELSVEDTTISTSAAGGTGIFAYGNGVVNVSNVTIATTDNTSGAIHVAGGGTLYAKDVTATTEGQSSAAIRSDRGGGTMVIEGGSFTSNGTGSPAVYVTADIEIENAQLTANGSEALCLEGLNSVSLTDCDLTGNMADDSQNDNTWTVILYQSMSGDSEIGKGTFSMADGSLTALNGGVFYTTNTESEFTLENVTIETAEDCEYILRCTGNSNQRGWGQTGSNGAVCTFNAIRQTLNGDVIWDSISQLTLKLTDGSVLIGAIIDDETCTGEGGNGSCDVTIDADSQWIVTGDSALGSLENAGSIVDAEGQNVTIQSADGEILRAGDSCYTITVASYTEA